MVAIYFSLKKLLETMAQYNPNQFLGNLNQCNGDFTDQYLKNPSFDAEEHMKESNDDSSCYPEKNSLVSVTRSPEEGSTERVCCGLFLWEFGLILGFSLLLAVGIVATICCYVWKRTNRVENESKGGEPPS